VTSGLLGRTHRLGVLPGDGVGPELITQALRVLAELARLDGFSCDLVEFPHSAAHYRRSGELFGEEAFAELQTCESLLFGAAGDPSLPPGVMERALILDLSRRLQLSIGVRYAYLHAAHLSPVKGLDRGDVDIAIVRDTTEGELVVPGGVLHEDEPGETAATVLVHTRHAVDRTLRYAFELARRRRRKVSLVSQSNVLVPHQLWERRLHALAGDYPDVECEALYPDHAAMELILAPQRFDVIATTLFLGGVFSDQAGAIVGGIGLIGSVRINPRTRFGFYEPAHGSAPKHAGMDRVSPMATLNALAMLLDDVGEERSALRLRTAIDAVLGRGEVGLTTRSPVGTTAATDAVIDALGEDAPAARAGER
jgi:3-isopropylmalate dehydrogenase